MTDVADIDRELAELGGVPDDIDELLARYGEDDLSGGHIDSLLESLSQGVEQVEVAALGVESVPPPQPEAADTQAGDLAAADADAAVEAGEQPADPILPKPSPRPRRDTMVDRPSVPVQADPVDVQDEIEDELEASPALEALFSDPPTASVAEAQVEDGDDEDEVELSYGSERPPPRDDEALDAETDGLFDTLEDEEPVSALGDASPVDSDLDRDAETPLVAAPAVDALFGDDERPTTRSSAPPAEPMSEDRRSDLKQLLRTEMDPGDFPQTEPPTTRAELGLDAPQQSPQAAQADVPEEDADEDDFELLVDEDDIEEIDIDDDELEIIEE